MLLTVAVQQIDNPFGQSCSFEAYGKNKMYSTAIYTKLREAPVMESERKKGKCIAFLDYVLEHEKHAIYLNQGFEVGLLKKERKALTIKRENIDSDHI